MWLALNTSMLGVGVGGGTQTLIQGTGTCLCCHVDFL